MKAKTTIILLLAISITTLGFVTATSKHSAESIKKEHSLTSPSSVRATQQQNADPAGTINGANNPDQIPDHVAYSLLFRFVSEAPDAASQQRVRHYIRRMGLGRCYTCPGEGPAGDRGTEQDIDAFLAVSNEFKQRVGVLDQQVVDIKRRHWPNPSPEVMAQLRLLQRQKETTTNEIVASLPNRLSANGLNKVRSFVKDQLKRKIKITA